jgi:cystathionine gamma-synthase
MKSKLKFETRAIKSTQSGSTNVKPLSTPIYLSSTFERNEDGSYDNDFQYSRADNPNRRILENSIAQLENGESCFAFSSGMAAISAILQSLKTGDHVILPDDVYYNIYSLTTDVFERWGLQTTTVDMSDLEQVKQAIKENTKMIWAETPSNPQLKITDIQELSSITKAHKLTLVVDNTWPSPVLQNPLDIGADIVMHSTTKYFGGHSDVLGGCVVLKENNKIAESIHSIQKNMGAVPSPFDCWLIARGIQTLHLRVTAQTKTALALAEYLEEHPKIDQVLYPGLESHPQHHIAAKQMKNGFGAMLSVIVKGDQQNAVDVSNRLEHFTAATSLGAVESLVEHRKSVEGPDSKTPNNLLRVSVGLENIDDLINDWRQCLK